MHNIAYEYVQKLDKLISNIHHTNQSLLLSNVQCDELHDQFLFNSTIREVFLIKTEVPFVCSSKRGVLNKDLSQYYPSGIVRSGEHLRTLNADHTTRTLIIRDGQLGNPHHGISTVINEQFLENSLGYTQDTRLKSLILSYDGATLPERTRLEKKDGQYIAGSRKYPYMLGLTPAKAFISNQTILYLYSAALLSLIVSSAYLFLHHWLVKRLSLLDELKKALKRRELFLVYQPIVVSQSNQISGFEALLRWYKPKTGFISPEHFIDLAEKSGLIVDITEYVLYRAWQDWSNKKVVQPLHLSINIPPSYLEDPSTITQLKRYADRFKTINIQLVVEITERQLLKSSGQAVLNELRQANIHIAIDDFGIGSTALSILQNIEFDYLKIDKCFIDSIEVEDGHTPVLNSIVDLGHRLSVQLVAEGVESQTQADYLHELKVGYQQGFWHAKPMDILAASKLVAQNG
ncbi:EAL domain-containing protein [Vibrio eleionomae]|nr:EAL domain-containing protein [Vibrio eleionomae]